MNDFAERSDRRSVWILLCLMTALILYGSLYPFHFSRAPASFFAWELPGGLSSIRDIAINLGIYFPAGFLAFYALPQRTGAPGRIFFATLFSLALSGGIEFIQAFDQGRFSSSIDLLFNVLGGVTGAVAASLLGLRVPAADWMKKHPAPFVLILLAVSSHLYPFFPLVHLGPLKASFARFGTAPFFPWQAVSAALEWLGCRVLLAALLERETVTWELAALELSIPAGLVILDQAPTLSECLGALLALAAGHFWRPCIPQFAPLMVLDLVVRELAPFRFSATAIPFQWVPFSGFAETVPLAVGVVLTKFYLYGLAIWVFSPGGRHVLRVTALIAGLLYVLELGQCYLPGRTPEITDCLMAMLAGIALWLAHSLFNSRHGTVVISV